MSTLRHAPDRPDVRNPQICAVCGSMIEKEGDIEDSSGWRWFSDGEGGLLPLCPSCPVPQDIASTFEDTARA